MGKEFISFYFEPVGDGDEKKAEDVEVGVRYKLP
jgi:hypothetical protein